MTTLSLETSLLVTRTLTKRGWNKIVLLPYLILKSSHRQRLLGPSPGLSVFDWPRHGRSSAISQPPRSQWEARRLPHSPSFSGVQIGRKYRQMDHSPRWRTTGTYSYHFWPLILIFYIILSLHSCSMYYMYYYTVPIGYSDLGYSGRAAFSDLNPDGTWSSSIT